MRHQPQWDFVCPVARNKHNDKQRSEEETLDIWFVYV